MCPAHVGLLGWASHKDTGEAVPPQKIVAPYSLVFVPDNDLKSAYAADIHGGKKIRDLTCESKEDCPDMLEMLMKHLKTGTKVWTVYGIASPGAMKKNRPWSEVTWRGVDAVNVTEQLARQIFDLDAIKIGPSSGVYKIGLLEATSDGTTSVAGDEKLFMKHELFEDAAIQAFCTGHLEGKGLGMGPADWTKAVDWTKDMEFHEELRGRNDPVCGPKRELMLCRMKYRTDEPAMQHIATPACREAFDFYLMRSGIHCDSSTDPRLAMVDEKVKGDCPACTCKSPSMWPVSGCDVTCGAMCPKQGCCCMPGVGSCPAEEDDPAVITKKVGDFMKRKMDKFKKKKAKN